MALYNDDDNTIKIDNTNNISIVNKITNNIGINLDTSAGEYDLKISSNDKAQVQEIPIITEIEEVYETPEITTEENELIPEIETPEVPILENVTGELATVPEHTNNIDTTAKHKILGVYRSTREKKQVK